MVPNKMVMRFYTPKSILWFYSNQIQLFDLEEILKNNNLAKKYPEIVAK